MPIYDYRCRDCDKTFELLIRGTAVPVCPTCAGLRLEKLVSLPAPPAQSPGMIGRARAQAAREGHFSHYRPSEKPRPR